MLREGESSNQVSNLEHSWNRACPAISSPISYDPEQPSLVSINLHMPCCTGSARHCLFRSCDHNHGFQSRSYIDHLVNELRIKSALVKDGVKTLNFFWHGGLSALNHLSELTEIIFTLNRHYPLEKQTMELFGIELTMDNVCQNNLALLHGIGFNEIILLTPPPELYGNRADQAGKLKEAVEFIRSYQFKYLHIYCLTGLKSQSLQSYKDYLDDIIDCQPDKITLFTTNTLPFHLTVAPEAIISGGNDSITGERVNIQDECGNFSELSHSKLTNSGYSNISHRTYVSDNHLEDSGIKPCASHEVIGLGLSSYSLMDNQVIQNVSKIKEYYRLLDEGCLPVKKSYELGIEAARQAIALLLGVNGSLLISAIEDKYQVKFEKDFPMEFKLLERLSQLDEIILANGEIILYTPQGQLGQLICGLFASSLEVRHQALHQLALSTR